MRDVPVVVRVMRVLDLFSGIGGFALGLERAGFRTVAFCEIEPFCRGVLKKHWPGVPCYEDVRTLTGARLAADGVVADAICGGFPCQDISVAGPGGGLDGARSSLWFAYERIIGEVRPRWAIIENSPRLRSLGLDRVLGGLNALGYDAEWHCVPAAAVGAFHRRDRIWIVAYPNGLARLERRQDHSAQRARGRDAHRGDLGADVADAHSPRLEIIIDRPPGQRAALVGARPWPAEPDVARVAYGVPRRVDRVTALGNAVVPQIAEIIGRAVMTADQPRPAPATGDRT